MTEQLYRTMVWMHYRMAVVFGAELPLVLLLWATLRQEGALVRMMGLYWKVASLMAISVLLLTDARPLGYLTSLLAQLAVIVTIWFWVDLNEELADMPPWRSLPLTLRIWRWALTATCLFGLGLGLSTLPCFLGSGTEATCAIWLEAPLRLHDVLSQLFSFLFGARWTPAVAAFVGYLALVAYAIGFLQWLIMRLPRQGRVAGEF